VLAVWPTLQGESMVVRAALGDGRAFGAPVDLEAGVSTVGRVDAAPWGDGFLAIWMGAGQAQGDSALRLAHVGAALERSASQILAKLPAGRSSGVPRLAAADGVALAAWVEAREGVPTIRAARIVDAVPDPAAAGAPP
jgi:hypothetical protein